MNFKRSKFGFVRCVNDWNKKRFVYGVKVYKYIDSDGMLVASCYVKNHTIYNFVVSPIFRGIGLGSDFLKKVEDDNRISILSVIPQDNDESVVNFYEKNGWHHFVNRTDSFYDEDDKDCWEMRKFIV